VLDKFIFLILQWSQIDFFDSFRADGVVIPLTADGIKRRLLPTRAMQDLAPLLSVLRSRLDEQRRKGAPVLIGVAGSVAVGKTTFAEALAPCLAQWDEAPRVEIVATDGFLYSNRALAERNLTYRKGFPESYDVAAFATALEDLKRLESVSFPLYSHTTYDVDPNATRTLRRPDIVILDGLHLARVMRTKDGARLIDTLIYLDAAEEDVARWFHSRLIPLMQAGRTDPASFYHSFRSLDDQGLADFSERVWR
jgi:type I pantothenate kinase